MMLCNPQFGSFTLVTLALLSIALAGCSQSQPPPSATLLSCRVLIEGRPALEVRLVLLQYDQGVYKPVLDGVADASGTIAMKLVEGAQLPEGQAEFVARIESIGSGEWQLSPPWSNPASSKLKVKWPTSQETVDLVLPKSAIRSI